MTEEDEHGVVKAEGDELDGPSEETDWDAENELIETIEDVRVEEAEEDERMNENCVDDLSGSSFTPTQEIEAEEDERVEDYAPNLSGSSFSSPSCSQETEPEQSDSTPPTVQKKSEQMDYTHPFDLLFDQPTEEEIDWEKLIAAMKRSLGEIETEEKPETTTSTRSFDSGHRKPEKSEVQNSVCGLKSEEEMGEDGEDREDGRT